MNKAQRDIRRKKRVLEHAARIGNVRKTCRYFGVARSGCYVWKKAYETQGDDGLVNQKPCPYNPRLRTPSDIVEKVLHLRRTYHLGPIRIVWYLARYHGMTISKAGVYRILRRARVPIPQSPCSRSAPSTPADRHHTRLVAESVSPNTPAQDCGLDCTSHQLSRLSHQPTRQRERQMRRFKSAVYSHLSTCFMVRLPEHLLHDLVVRTLG